MKKVLSSSLLSFWSRSKLRRTSGPHGKPRKLGPYNLQVAQLHLNPMNMSYPLYSPQGTLQGGDIKRNQLLGRSQSLNRRSKRRVLQQSAIFYIKNEGITLGVQVLAGSRGINKKFSGFLQYPSYPKACPKRNPCPWAETCSQS